MPGCKKRRRDGLNGVLVICFFIHFGMGLFSSLHFSLPFLISFFFLFLLFSILLIRIGAGEFCVCWSGPCLYLGGPLAARISLYSIYTYFLFSDQRSTTFFNANHSNRNPQFLVCTEGMVVQVGPYFVAYLRLKWGYSQEQGFGSETTNG